MTLGNRTGAGQSVEQEGSTIRSAGNLGPVLLAAGGVVIVGTALVDSDRLRLLLVPGFFLLLVFGAGALVDRVLGGLLPGTHEKHDRPVMLVLGVQLGIGIACVSLLTWVAALFGTLWVAGLAAVPLLAYGLYLLIQFGFRNTHWRGSLSRYLEQRVLLGAVGGLAVGAFWLVAWLWATIPPTFFDELEYHLVIPQRTLMTGELPAISWVFYTLMPYASDLLLGWGMVFDSVLGARALQVALWIACSLSVWGLAEAVAWPRTSHLAAPIVATVLAVSPTLWFLATLSFGETCLSLAMVTAMAVLAAPAVERRPWMALGLLLGLAATVKLTGMYWVAAGLAAAAVAGWSRWDLVRTTLIVGICVAPWWGRALFHTGNPIYPMAYGLLGGRYWSVESQARVMGDASYTLADLGMMGLIRLPVDLVQHPERFGSGSDAGLLAIVATGALLVLPVVSRLAGWNNRIIRVTDAGAVFVMVAALGWVLTATITRYFAPALVIGLTALASLALSLERRGQVAALAVLAAAGIWGTWQFVTIHSAVFSSSDVALGRERPEAYLTRQLDHFEAARFVQKKVSRDARVLFIGETRPYYFSREAVAPTAYDQHPLERWVQETSSPEALASRLAQEGISHVVLNVREFNRLQHFYGLLAFSGPNGKAYDRRLKELPRVLHLLFSKNGVFVFEVPTRSNTKPAGQKNGREGVRS